MFAARRPACLKDAANQRLDIRLAQLRIEAREVSLRGTSPAATQKSIQVGDAWRS
jgi:hypothetical protein